MIVLLEWGRRNRTNSHAGWCFGQSCGDTAHPALQLSEGHRPAVGDPKIERVDPMVFFEARLKPALILIRFEHRFEHRFEDYDRHAKQKHGNFLQAKSESR
jgi:hypothetical protein